MHRKLFGGARAEILLLCAEILPSWASCRNITVQEPSLPGNPCRAIFGHVQKYWFLEEIFTSGSETVKSCTDNYVESLVIRLKRPKQQMMGRILKKRKTMKTLTERRGRRMKKI